MADTKNALAELAEVMDEPVDMASIHDRGLVVLNAQQFSAYQKAQRIIAELAEVEFGNPLRNCDVGTAAEQSERYKKFCYAYRSREKRCGDCPLCDTPCCDFAWLQMPYEEGAKNGE